MTSMGTPAAVRPRAGWMRKVIAALGFSLLVAGGGLREDELECEEAVAHLQECCPDFADATIQCVHGSYCSTEEPALTIGESACVLVRSCSDVIQSGLCEATKNLESRGTDPEGNPFNRASVCP